MVINVIWQINFVEIIINHVLISMQLWYVLALAITVYQWDVKLSYFGRS